MFHLQVQHLWIPACEASLLKCCPFIQVSELTKEAIAAAREIAALKLQLKEGLLQLQGADAVAKALQVGLLLSVIKAVCMGSCRAQLCEHITNARCLLALVARWFAGDIHQFIAALALLILCCVTDLVNLRCATRVCILPLTPENKPTTVCHPPLPPFPLPSSPSQHILRNLSHQTTSKLQTL